MRLPSTPAGTARWSWVAAMLIGPFVQVAVWLMMRPVADPKAPDYLQLFQGQAMTGAIFGVIAGMIGMLLWPLTRRVIARTSGRGWWKGVLRLLYGGAIGAVCGLFIAYHLSFMPPGAVPFRSVTEHMDAVVPPIVTGLIWAVLYMLVERAGRAQPSKPT